jgi:hypothetical protein
MAEELSLLAGNQGKEIAREGSRLEEPRPQEEQCVLDDGSQRDRRIDECPATGHNVGNSKLETQYKYDHPDVSLRDCQ